MIINRVIRSGNNSNKYIFSCLLNLVAGCLMILAFAPWSWYPIAVPIIAVVLHNWLKYSPKSAFKLGILFGFSYALGSSYWVYYSLHDYGQALIFLAAAAAVVFAAILSLFFAVLAALVSYHRRYPPAFLYLLIFPALWVLAEWARSVLFVGFPWNLLGQILIDSPWYGILPLFGILGGSAVVAICAGAVVYFFRLQTPAKTVFGILFGLFLTATSALQFIEWTRPTSDELKASVIQANIPQKLKFDRPYLQRLVNQYLDLSMQHTDSDLILWPETAIPIYADMLEKQLTSVGEQLNEQGTVLLTGIFYRDREQGKRYNSLMNVNSNDFYHKRRLVPFGEYIPLRSVFEVFSNWIIIPMSDLHAAEMTPILDVSDYNAGVSICYEIAFANDIADSLPAADFLINVSNDSWFGDSLAPHQMLQMARVRAAENERYMVRATNTGISAIIDHRGRIVEQSELFEVGSISYDIIIRKGITPYAQWRDMPILIWLMISLLAAWLTAWYTNKKRKELRQ